MPSICIVIPAYNEEKRIGPTLVSYSKFFEGLEKIKKIKHRMLIVINNTTDKTEEIVKEHILKHKSMSYINLEQGGKGYAVIEGFKKALTMNTDYIGFVDADLATPPEEYYKLILRLSNCDGAIG